MYRIVRLLSCPNRHIIHVVIVVRSVWKGAWCRCSRRRSWWTDQEATTYLSWMQSCMKLILLLLPPCWVVLSPPHNIRIHLSKNTVHALMRSLSAAAQGSFPVFNKMTKFDSFLKSSSQSTVCWTYYSRIVSSFSLQHPLWLSEHFLCKPWCNTPSSGSKYHFHSIPFEKTKKLTFV